MSAASVIKELKTLAKPQRVEALQRFYKTSPGEYGEGDLFLGISVPVTRSVAAEHKDLLLSEIEKLLGSPFHEVRLCALIILVNQYKKLKNRSDKKKSFELYLRQLKLGSINNWDLIDVSAPTIGDYLMDHELSQKTLIKLAKSKSLWERRASILFTFAFIRSGEFDQTIFISRLLLSDEHDLIHKATGWMLREVGKREPKLLRGFLKEHAQEMPRTMLRYAIEKLPENERKKWLINSKN